MAPIDKLSVVFAIALAGVFLRERLTWRQWLGGALIVTEHSSSRGSRAHLRCVLL